MYDKNNTLQYHKPSPFYPHHTQKACKAPRACRHVKIGGQRAWGQGGFLLEYIGSPPWCGVTKQGNKTFWSFSIDTFLLSCFFHIHYFPGPFTSSSTPVRLPSPPTPQLSPSPPPPSRSPMPAPRDPSSSAAVSA